MKQDVDEIFDFQVAINNYESLVNELTQELRSVKSDHDQLKIKLSGIVIENQELTKELSKTLTPTTSNIFLDQKDLVDNLKQQIQTLLAEKDYIAKLWQNTLKTVEVLEGELSVFQAGAQNFVPRKDVAKIKLGYDEKIGLLERELSIAKKKLEEPLRKNPFHEVKSNPSGLDLNLETHTGALKIVKNLEEEVLVLQNRIQESEKTRSKLQKILKHREDAISDLTRANNQYRDKVGEAVQVVEAALNEKDAALLRERVAQEEIQKVSQELSNIMTETEEKIRKEVANVKLEYAGKYENLNVDLKKNLEDLKSKDLQIDKVSVHCAMLENQIEKYQKGTFNTDDSYTSKLLILEKNLESTFQKLLVSEKLNIQLSSEKETIKNDISQMAEQYDRTLKTKELEKMAFQNKAKQLQSNLDETNFTLSKIKQEFDSLVQEKKESEKQWKIKLDEQEKNLMKSYSDKIAEMVSQNKETIGQLQLQLDSKNQINKKWSVETKVITENLEKLVSDLKSELKKVKKDNTRLKRELQESQQKFEQYKVFLQVISNDVDKISYMSKSSPPR